MQIVRVHRAILTRFLPAVLLAAPASTLADAARMVEDVGEAPDSAQGDNLRTLGATSSHFFFQIDGSILEPRLWATDGTFEGTEPVEPHCETGPCRRVPTWIGATDALAFFVGQDSQTNRFHYFASDGTNAGTREILPPDGSQFVGAYEYALPVATIFRQRLFLFTTAPGPQGFQLVSTSGAGSSFTVHRETRSPEGCVALRDYVVVFEHGDLDILVWRTDGTPPGTTASGRVTGLRSPHSLAAGNRLAFFGGNSDGGLELWRTDGTTAGTFAVTVLPDPYAEIVHTQALGDRAAAIVDDASLGSEIVLTDGTIAGSRIATAFGYEGAMQPVDDPGRLALLPDHVLAIARDGLGNWQLNSIPFETGPMGLLREVCSGGCETPAWVIAVEQGAVFNSGGADGIEPWVTDGTITGTVELADSCPGDCSSNPYPIVGDGRRLIFGSTARDGSIWSTRGSAATTFLLDDSLTGDPDGSVGWTHNRWSQVGAVTAFPAFDATYHLEIWFTDLTPGSARLLGDVSVSAAPQGREHIGGSGGRAVFIATKSPVTLPRLWFTDEQAGGATEVAGDYVVGYTGPSARDQLFEVADRTVFVADPPTQITAIDPSGNSIPLAAPGGASLLGNPAPHLGLVFLVQDSNQNVALWNTDGTAAGTVLRATFDADDGLFSGPFAVASRALAFRWNAATGNQLVAFNAGLNAFSAIASFPTPVDQPSPVLPAGSEIGFFTVTDYFVSQLWRTDGTAAGTDLLVERSGGERLVGAISFGGAYYLVTRGFQTPGHLWRSDGTPAGTSALVELPTGYFEPFVPLASAGPRFVFPYSALDGASLWVSDGTVAGTRSLTGIPDPATGNWTDQFVAVPGGALYVDADPAHGNELWFSDGTDSGTRRIHDILPGGGSSWPSAFQLSGNAVYFFAHDGVHGREPWVLDLSGASSCLQTDVALCIGGDRFRAEARWRAFDGSVGEAQAVPITADTGTFWFFDDDNIELILKVIDGNGYNGHHWVFYGALSNVEYTVTVTDTETGASRRYFNPAGRFASSGDITAFGPQGAHASGTVIVETLAGVSPVLASPLPSAGAGASGTCFATATRFCILGNRFGVEATWRDFVGNTGVANAGTLTDDTGYLWFFDDANVEVVVKAVDGSEFNDHFWIYYGALSNVEYTITVTDTAAGTHRTYRNPLGAFGSFGDIEAFPAD